MELENWIIIGINNGVSKSLHVTRTSKCLTQLRNYWNFKPVKQFRPKLGWTYIYILIGSDNHAVEHVQCLIVWCNDWNRCLYQFARSYTIYIILYISYNIYIILYISLAEFWNSHYFVFDSKVEFYSKNTINFFEIRFRYHEFWLIKLYPKVLFCVIQNWKKKNSWKYHRIRNHEIP